MTALQTALLRFQILRDRLAVYPYTHALSLMELDGWIDEMQDLLTTDPNEQATRWIAITPQGLALDIARTTPSGKRLRSSTKQDILDVVHGVDGSMLYPLVATTRCTPLTTPVP